MSLEFKGSHCVEPIYFHRDYEKDFRSKDQKEVSKVDSSWIGIVQRTAFASLPFFSLYKPFGFPLALAMGSVRVLTASSELYRAVQKGYSVEISGQVLQTAIAVGALAGTILAHPFGMLITTGQDTFLDAGYLVHALSEGDYKKASERTLSLVNNTLYLGLFFAGSLELSIASLAVQVISGLYHSSEDFKNDRWIEGTAHLFMSGVRGHQLAEQVNTLQLRNEFEKKMKAFIKQVKAAEKKTREEAASEDANNSQVSPERITRQLEVSHVKMNAEPPSEAEEVAALIKKYACSKTGYLALENAARQNDLDAVNKLIAHGEHPSEALHGAIAARHMPLLKYLVEDLKLPLEGRITKHFPWAWWTAWDGEWWEGFDYLVSRGGELPPLDTYRSIDSLERMIAKGCKFCPIMREGYQVLWLSWIGVFGKSEDHRLAFFQALVNKDTGIDIDIRVCLEWDWGQNGHGTTPLFWAVQNNDVKLTKVLLELGANPNYKVESRDSSTLWIARNSTKNKEIEALLMQYGAV